jgi:acyl carrier protein
MNATECTTEFIAARLRLCLPHLAAQLRDDVRLGNLALDSMDTVEFLCVVHEEFGVRLTEAEFHPQQTIGGLFAAIAEKSDHDSLITNHHSLT